MHRHDRPTPTTAAAGRHGLHPKTKRRRRILLGLSICAATLVLLAVVLEVAARFVVPAEIFSFKPVYAIDDVAGYRFRTGVSEYAFGAQLATNAFGHRGPEWSERKADRTFRIALIGDSLAFGFGVEFRHTFGEVLARAIQKHSKQPCEILNFGVPGYNSEQEFAVLENIALGFDPDLVLVLICGNDHQDALWVDATGSLHFGEKGTEDTRVESERLPRQDKWGILRHSALLTWVKLAWSRHQANRIGANRIGAKRQNDPDSWLTFDPSAPIAAHLQHRVLRPLLRMVDSCRSRDLPIALLSFVDGQDYARVIHEITKRTRAPSLDLLTLFPEVESWPAFLEKFSLGWDGHPNAVAHARWARGTFELLERHSLLPAR